jgi:hypothetical protein
MSDVIISAGPRQRSHSRVRDPLDSGPYFVVSTRKAGLRIYVPKE